MSVDKLKNNSFFRKEIVSEKQDQWLGELTLSRSTSNAALVWGFFVLAAVLLAYLNWGEYTRKIRASGTLVPDAGVIKVMPNQTGLITQLRVKEGQSVAEGDVLAVINTERATVRGDISTEIGKQLSIRREMLQLNIERTKELYAQQNRAMDARLGSMRTELDQLAAAIKLQQNRIALTEKILTNQRKLFAERFLSEMSLQQKEQEWLTELASLESLRRTHTALLRDIGNVAAEKAALGPKLDNELLSVQRELATLTQDGIENESRRELLLKAPQAGVVTAILADVGKLAAEGSPIMNLIPAGSELQADVYLPARAAGFVRVGTKAVLQFQAFPYQKFGSQQAEVIKMSRVAIAASELPYPPPQSQSSDLYYIASLSLPKKTVLAYGKEQPLQAGMGFDANLSLDKRTLIEWVFEPVFSISGNLL